MQLKVPLDAAPYLQEEVLSLGAAWPQAFLAVVMGGNPLCQRPLTLGRLQTLCKVVKWCSGQLVIPRRNSGSGVVPKICFCGHSASAVGVHQASLKLLGLCLSWSSSEQP